MEWDPSFLTQLRERAARLVEVRVRLAKAQEDVTPRARLDAARDRLQRGPWATVRSAVQDLLIDPDLPEGARGLLQAFARSWHIQEAE